MHIGEVFRSHGAMRVATDAPGLTVTLSHRTPWHVKTANRRASRLRRVVSFGVRSPHTDVADPQRT
jgi:hypothetical protein